ncbi:hypothetical protein DUNSADRAFT_11970 [Dunaliella salina]|uniref:NADPH--hemoprotein reductase n=1 Tax=Dunaliella salina TaxID=3046 RepID=A0ABQ7GCD4_DUNSA|nr:hypothetical protein DUNSADRAFT_11970 [Dunaliella salina]|eukprot:KAF5832213.1 hypothetical protein DUNSADRAFT_11970 [Dunaliella salina]
MGEDGGGGGMYQSGPSMYGLGMHGIAGFATLSVCAISVGLLCYKRYSQQQQQQQLAARQAALKKSANQEALMRPSLDDSGRKRVRVLFGTQTGTAERFAKHIGGELKKHHGESTSVDVIDLESYSAERQLAREKLVVLCVATYGDGEPTDNAADFFSWLSKEVEAVNAGEKEPFMQGVLHAVDKGRGQPVFAAPLRAHQEGYSEPAPEQPVTIICCFCCFQEIAERLGQSLDTVLSLSMPEGSIDRLPPFTGRLSLRTALTWFADVLASPHKDVLASLSTFASNPDEAKLLRSMASPEGKGQYADFIAKPHRSLLEVLRAFPSVKPSLGAFFGCIAPRMQPRYYSISSSPKAHPSAVHITASVVRDVMPTGRVHEGIATTFLQNAPVGTKVPSFIRPSHFKLPPSPQQPIIMVGPGTGLAPFRGFLQERAALRKSGCSLGPAKLFFGCRHSRHDYLYQEELAKHLVGGELSELHAAFSREGPQKDYVQHHMARDGDHVWDLLAKQQGYLYMCGDAKAMAKDVHKTLVAIAQERMHCSGTQAETWVKENLQDSGRYQRDVW